ncbi:MAG: hypothetical protein ACREJ3_04485, partial [Polyangiaceae bacterium]
RIPPFRSVNDPTAGTYLPVNNLPMTATMQANGGAGPGASNRVAQCAFFPPLGINNVNHDLYFATTQLYKSTDTGDVRGDAWATISPVLATPQGAIFGTLDTDNVITALGVGDDGAVYVGTYIGEIWVSAHPCASLSCWNKVAGPGTSSPMPHLPISSFAVQPESSATAYVTLSGFGTTNHVWQTSDGGSTWIPKSVGLVDAPANAIRVDSLGTLRLGTDIGLYTLNAGTWRREITLPFVPVTAITSWPTGAGTERLYAGTHGRGAWVLAGTDGRHARRLGDERHLGCPRLRLRLHEHEGRARAVHGVAHSAERHDVRDRLGRCEPEQLRSGRHDRGRHQRAAPDDAAIAREHLGQ